MPIVIGIGVGIALLYFLGNRGRKVMPAGLSEIDTDWKGFDLSKAADTDRVDISLVKNSLPKLALATQAVPPGGVNGNPGTIPAFLAPAADAPATEKPDLSGLYISPGHAPIPNPAGPLVVFPPPPPTPKAETSPGGWLGGPSYTDPPTEVIPSLYVESPVEIMQDRPHSEVVLKNGLDFTPDPPNPHFSRHSIEDDFLASDS